MAKLTEPTSMEGLLYFTRRSIGRGKVVAWVRKQPCPKCGKGLMGKPTYASGKVKIRAKEYVCSSCGHKIPKETYEPSLLVEINYVCPHCGNDSSTTTPFERTNIRIFDEETGKFSNVKTIRFACEKCGKTIDITKQMK
ncbi:MAG: hypothetical protein QXU88_02965 [Candidatus Woesearchaeota archaeon]